ncbi:MAG: acyltransferase [Acinetobacter sp.]
MKNVRGGVLGHVILWCERFCRKQKEIYYRTQYQGQGFICGDTVLQNPENINIGKGSFINSGYVLASPNAKITIGNHCMISQNVHMRTEYHIHDRVDIPIYNQGQAEKDIVIGDDVWIGFGAQVMSGIKIGNGVIIGAGAIVTHDCEPYCIYAGVPAIKIKERNKSTVGSE